MDFAGSLKLYAAARQSAATVDRSDRGHIVVSGRDRATYLQGLVTNDVASLKAGEGCYAAFLTPQGRMLADLVIYELGDRMLLALGRDVKDALVARLDQMIFAEDVQLGDVSDTFESVAVVGPDSPRITADALRGLGDDELRALPEHGNRRAAFAGGAAIVLRVDDIGEPGYDILVDAPNAPALRDALAAKGAAPLDEATAEALRIEAGIPRFHKDMDEDTIPLEAGIEARAISFTKGCYVGQEVIIRVLHRGHGRIARKLVGLTLAGEAVPSPGAAVDRDGRQIGHVTSSTMSPALKCPVALGYVHRDFAAAGTSVSIAGTPAVVTELPFVAPGRHSHVTGSSRSNGE